MALPKDDFATINQGWRIADAAWAELQRSLYVQARLGVTPTRLPDISFSEAKRRSDSGRALLKSLQALDTRELPHNLALTLRLVRFRAQTWSREADWYWLAVDPTGSGSFGIFLPTAYCGAYLLDTIHSQLAGFAFRCSGDLDRYLALVCDYERLLDQFRDRAAGQAERGIYMPRVQIHQARAILNRFKVALPANIGVSMKRLGNLQAGEFEREIRKRIETRLGPAFERVLGELSGAYFSRAPDTVGIGQYPGGPEVYADLVRLYTTLDLTPEEVCSRGLIRMEEIETEMASIRAGLGFKGAAEFLKHLEAQPQWRAETVEGVVAMFQRYIDRIAPLLSECFFELPRASYRAMQLPDALQGSMTFGYYDAPRKDRAEGRYLFNAANLTQQPLFHVGALTYHELMPGHHLHLAAQQEDAELHPFRAYCLVTAYVEGWAEYAATFAGELGLYHSPEERYGRLVMESLLTSRLVVDPGMNVMGWSLEKARDYMRLHSGMREAEILTESIRYSCDYIGQALAYKLGDAEILSLRRRMRQALGDRFDLREFHAAILKPGALPMPDLAWHMEHEIQRLRERNA